MSVTPTEDREPTREEAARIARRARKARLLVLAAILLAIAVVVIIVVVMVGQGTGGGDSDSADSGNSSADVTSPNDLHELPSDAGLGDVEDATLVSIALVNDSGTVDYYGLSSDTEPAAALIKAVSDASGLDASEVPAAVSETAATDSEQQAPTITFLFPDYGTLTFGLYVEQGIVTRGGSFWQVDGDLSALIEAATSYQQQQ